jgi:hypothetical protein
MPLPSATSKIVYPRSSAQSLSFNGFPLGINKSVGAKQLEIGELVEGLNIMYNDEGKIITRPGLRKVTAPGADDGAAIKYISNGLLDISGTYFDEHLFDSVTFDHGDQALKHCVIAVDENYKIYELEGANLNDIGTAEAPAMVAPFGGYVVVFDGSYIKYWDGHDFKIAYDYGSGESGFQFDDTDLTDDTSDTLDSAAHTRFGGSFTTQLWTTGLTIPILNVKAVLSKTGSPTGNLVAKLYKADRSTVHAASLNFDVSDLTTDAVSVDIPFDPDNTFQMVPNTAYFLSLEYSGGDGSNYVKVHLDTVTSGGTAAYYDGSWHTVATQTPLIAVQPGKPPKATFGAAWQNRLWFLDPQNPGWARYTNANSIFDYSTSGGAGYVGSVDDNAKNFPIGTIVPLYGDLYLIGRKEAPYISKITGATPSAFAQEVLLQTISGAPLVTASTGNDIWITNETNSYSVRGVQEYGDIRTNEPGNPVASIIQAYYDGDAFAAFNPIGGQYWVKLSGYNRVLVAHTRNPIKVNNAIRYPWTEYLFNGLTPSAFGFSIDTFYVGCTDGNLYAIDNDVLDEGAQPSYMVKSCVVETPFGGTQVKGYYASLNSDAAASLNMKLYRNGSATALVTKALTAQTARISDRLRFDCKSLQVELSSFVITKPVDIGAIYFKTLPMEV